MAVLESTGLTSYLHAEVPPPVPSLFWAGVPPTGPAPITVPAGRLPRSSFSNISGLYSAVSATGCHYGMWVTATWSSGSVTLQILSADQFTWVIVLTAFTANSFATVPRYRVNVATATAVYASLQNVFGHVGSFCTFGDYAIQFQMPRSDYPTT